MRRFALALTMSLALLLSGCQTFWAKVLPVVTEIITAVLDAEQQMDAIKGAIDVYFQAMPDKDAEARVRKAYDATKASLSIALRAAEGIRATGEGSYDKAFEDFRVTFMELLKVLKETGVLGQDGTMSARTGPYAGMMVKEPLALKVRGR